MPAKRSGLLPLIDPLMSKAALEVKIIDLGGDEWVMRHIADGVTLTKIARELLGCSRTALYEWIHDNKDREYEYKRARKVAGGALLEAGLHKIDDADEESTAGVQKARYQADYRAKLAAIYDPSLSQAQQKLQINIGEVHLDSLRLHGTPQPEQIEDAKFEALPAPKKDDLSVADLL